MKPHKELEFLYQEPIKEAKQVFGKHFTCKLETAPHGEQFEIAVIPLEFKSKKYDKVYSAFAGLLPVHATGHWFCRARQTRCSSTDGSSCFRRWNAQ